MIKLSDFAMELPSTICDLNIKKYSLSEFHDSSKRNGNAIHVYPVNSNKIILNRLLIMYI